MLLQCLSRGGDRGGNAVGCLVKKRVGVTQKLTVLENLEDHCGFENRDFDTSLTSFWAGRALSLTRGTDGLILAIP